MDYNHITEYLEKFKKLLFKGENTQRVIAETIMKHISIDISTTSIQIKGTTIRIQGSPMLRNEILIHKQGILSDLKELLTESNFTDIR